MLNITPKKIIVIIFIIVIITIGFLLVDITKKASKRANVVGNKSLHARTLDSTSITLNLNQPDTTFILIFNSECDICKIELTKLLSEYPMFETDRIYLLSRQNINTLKQVKIQFDLDKYPSIELFKIDEVNTEEPFNTASNPSLFIYDATGKLLFQRKGYTNPNELINLMKNEWKN